MTPIIAAWTLLVVTYGGRGGRPVTPDHTIWLPGWVLLVAWAASAGGLLFGLSPPLGRGTGPADALANGFVATVLGFVVVCVIGWLLHLVGLNIGFTE